MTPACAFVSSTSRPWQVIVSAAPKLQEALEECKGLAESWLSQPDSSLPNIIASGTTGVHSALRVCMRQQLTPQHTATGPVSKDAGAGNADEGGQEFQHVTEKCTFI